MAFGSEINTQIMSKTHIELLLKKLNIEDYIITVLGNNRHKLSIPGQVWIQQIKETFNVDKWEYSDGKATFYLS